MRTEPAGVGGTVELPPSQPNSPSASTRAVNMLMDRRNGGAKSTLVLSQVRFAYLLALQQVCAGVFKDDRPGLDYIAPVRDLEGLQGVLFDE